MYSIHTKYNSAENIIFFQFVPENNKIIIYNIFCFVFQEKSFLKAILYNKDFLSENRIDKNVQ